MAPEQGEAGDVGPPTDVYSVGVIMIQMLSGRQPVSGDSMMEILLQHVEGKYPRLSDFDVPPEVRSRLVNLVDAMTAIEPKDRPQTMREVREDLGQVRAEENMQELLIDPTDNLDVVFDAWLYEPLDAPSGRTEPPGDVTTGEEEALHRTDEHREGTGEAFADSRPGDPGGTTPPPDGRAPASDQSVPGSETPASLQDQIPEPDESSSSMGLGTLVALLRRACVVLAGLVYVVSITTGQEGGATEGGVAAMADAGAQPDGSTDAGTAKLAALGSDDEDAGGARAEAEEDAGGTKAEAGDDAGGTAVASGGEESTESSDDSGPGFFPAE